MAVSKPGNFAVSPTWQTYTPVLLGQTDSPGVTYSTQIGVYMVLASGLIAFRFRLVTSGTTTKTTLTDNFQVSLPFAAVTMTGDEQIFTAKVINATAVTVGLRGLIASGSSVATFENYQATATNPSVMTWATTSPGIGGLTTVITAEGNGTYQAA